MLLQSLVALSAGECDSAALASLTTQLADVTASCDGLMLEVLRAVDQRAQIQRIQEVHISSALAMALRKLNASYAKRTSELRETREQAEHLKAELEEAWKVAEDMAQEMDDLDNFHSGFSSESEPDGSEDLTRMDESVRLAEVIGVTGKAVAMKATLTRLHAERNRERERSDAENHSLRVSAARKRSIRASKASLRLPKSAKDSLPPSPGDRSSVSSRISRSRSKSVRRRSTHDSNVPSSYKPPMPLVLADAVSARKSPKDDSFLELTETRPVTPASPLYNDVPPPLPSKDSPMIPRTFSANVATPIDLIFILELPGPSQAQSGSSPNQRATLDFVIPPIMISPADGDPDYGTSRSARRVQSLQPPMRARSEPQDVFRRVASDHKGFDALPWQATSTKKTRRQSMPLTGFVGTSSDPLDHPPRVFSPPPSYTAHSSHSS